MSGTMREFTYSGTYKGKAVSGTVKAMPISESHVASVVYSAIIGKETTLQRRRNDWDCGTMGKGKASLFRTFDGNRNLEMRIEFEMIRPAPEPAKPEPEKADPYRIHELTELPPVYVAPIWEGGKLMNRDAIKWGASFEPPAIGSHIVVNVNRCGLAVVTGHYIQENFLGLKCELLNPPEWFIKQNGTLRTVYVLGTEIRHLTRLEKCQIEFCEADSAWDIELVKAFGARSACNARYTKAGRGEPGTALHAAYIRREGARIAYSALSGAKPSLL